MRRRTTKALTSAAAMTEPAADRYVRLYDRRDLKAFVGMKSRDHANNHLRQQSAKGNAQKDLDCELAEQDAANLGPREAQDSEA